MLQQAMCLEDRHRYLDDEDGIGRHYLDDMAGEVHKLLGAHHEPGDPGSRSLPPCLEPGEIEAYMEHLEHKHVLAAAAAEEGQSEGGEEGQGGEDGGEGGAGAEWFRVPVR